MNINRIIAECYEQLYIQNFDNLNEMDQFFKRLSLLKLTQGEIDYLDKPILIT